jgi:hypothetical protein
MSTHCPGVESAVESLALSEKSMTDMRLEAFMVSGFELEI